MRGNRDVFAQISIHAPSRERRVFGVVVFVVLNFNPRSLAGATFCNHVRFQVVLHFNPRSLAGATRSLSSSDVVYQYFNPRSLAGATCFSVPLVKLCVEISIHAPSRERLYQNSLRLPVFAFQSTLPRGSDVPAFPDSKAPV